MILHLGDGDDVVIIEGDAESVDDPETLESLAQRYAAKYVEPVVGLGATLRGGEQDIVYEVRPRRIMAWVYGNVTARTDWTPA